jgi:predicted MFS family arabinose efflux permease
MFTATTASTPYLYVISCLAVFIAGLALTMSPMTASIMSAVPARRAGAGSAMNDTTRELGAALGVAVLGSVAASRYASRLSSVTSQLSPAARHQARSSLTGALKVSDGLPHAASIAVQHGAKVAFVDGFRLACMLGALMAVAAAGLVWRYLPHQMSNTATDAPNEPVTELTLSPVLAEDG